MSSEIYCRSCGCVMRIRKGKFGKFYGCSAYPHCKNTMSVRDAELEPAYDELETANDHGDGSYYRYDYDKE